MCQVYNRENNLTHCRAGVDDDRRSILRPIDLPSPAEPTPPKRLRRLEAGFAKAGGPHAKRRKGACLGLVVQPYAQDPPDGRNEPSVSPDYTDARV